MKVKDIGLIILMSAFVLWVGENAYFGWNWKPESKAEVWTDTVVHWMLIIGLVLTFTKITNRKTKGVRRLIKERHEQITKHGRTIRWDIDRNRSRQLVSAAVMLTHPSTTSFDVPPMGWEQEWWNRIRSKPYQERLIIAAALLTAEYDRLDKMPKDPREEGH
jgi:hypothetical protein